MRKQNLVALALMSAVVVGTALNAEASFENMTFTWSGTYYQAGFSDDNYAPGSPTHLIASDDAIGIYKFTTDGTYGVPNPLYSICLSPAGLLDANPHTYTIETFATANPGIFPAAWASGVVGGVQQLWGIQNASYLFNTFGMKIINNTSGQAGDQNAQSAALEFAIWTALYDSTAYGKLGGTVWTAPTSQMDPSTTLADYNADLKALTTATSIPLYTGNILEGTGAPGDGAGAGDDQEFLVLGSPIPEPTTVITGALLLLPFGLSAARMLRKRRQA
jgi:hypothetical protein